jgi:hypothetical protein
VEVGDDVHSLGPHAAAQPVLERVGVQTVAVTRHADDRCAGEVERLERAQVGGVLDRDHVAVVAEDPGEQIQRLLRARGDEHLLQRHRLLGGDLLAQRSRPLGRPVLPCRRAGRALRRGSAGERGREQLGRERGRRRQATGHRQHPGLFGDAQQLADARGALAGDPLAEEVLHQSIQAPPGRTAQALATLVLATPVSSSAAGKLPIERVRAYCKCNKAASPRAPLTGGRW